MSKDKIGTKDKFDKPKTISEALEPRFIQNLIFGKILDKSNNTNQRIFSLLIIFIVTCVFIRMGHFYTAIYVMLQQTVMFREFINLKRDAKEDRQLKNAIWVSWYFFAAFKFYVVFKYLKERIYNTHYIGLQFLVNHHKFIFFVLYIAGFCIFVTSLREGHYKYQIKLFFWTHILLLLFNISSAVLTVIYDGLIWLIACIVLVAANDAFAFVFGKLFGKHQLIKLSAKKTVEGFIGGMCATIVVSLIVG